MIKKRWVAVVAGFIVGSGAGAGNSMLHCTSVDALAGVDVFCVEDAVVVTAPGDTAVGGVIRDDLCAGRVVGHCSANVHQVILWAQ